MNPSGINKFNLFPPSFWFRQKKFNQLYSTNSFLLHLINVKNIQKKDSKNVPRRKRY